ncbi:MAG TPA: DUF2303 family protein [Solirubrobacteraceae bacterium]|jgi:uncharacterized protein YfdQ (DUF2303 family)
MSGEPTINEADAAVIRDLATVAAGPTGIDAGATYAFTLPPGTTLEVEDFEHLLERPRRKRGLVHVHTYDALVAYVADHIEAPHTALWVDQHGARVLALLNGHSTDQPGWGDHRAELALRATPEWTHWAGLDGKLVMRDHFAEHVEDGLAQIVEPAAATMLEISQSVQATIGAEFRSASRLDSGEVSMVYDETIEAKAGRKGNLKIPSEFVLALAPYYGEQPYRVTARLRYRIKGGDLKIGYRLVDPHKVREDCINGIAERLRENHNVYLGAPDQFQSAR